MVDVAPKKNNKTIQLKTYQYILKLTDMQVIKIFA